MKQIWNTEELSEHWSLSYEELEFLKKKPYKNHIAVAIQLKYYKYFGCFQIVEKYRNIIRFLSLPRLLCN